MTLQEAIEAPHSVRAYKGQPLSDEIVKVLENQMMKLNNEGQLHLQLILNEPMAFQGTMAHHGENYKCRAHYDEKRFFVQALGKYLRGVFNGCGIAVPIYNMQSLRLDTPQRGVNIVGGRKVMAK